jgi:hypothetical protein
MSHEIFLRRRKSAQTAGNKPQQPEFAGNKFLCRLARGLNYFKADMQQPG